MGSAEDGAVAGSSVTSCPPHPARNNTTSASISLPSLLLIDLTPCFIFVLLLCETGEKRTFRTQQSIHSSLTRVNNPSLPTNVDCHLPHATHHLLPTVYLPPPMTIVLLPICPN